MVLAGFRCWPPTVSEMVADANSSHGMVFRALMVTGGLASMQTDLAALSAPAVGWPLLVLSALHQLRRVMLATTVGFCFAPALGSDFAVDPMRDSLSAHGEHMSRPRSGERLHELGLPWLADAALMHHDLLGVQARATNPKPNGLLDV